MSNDPEIENKIQDKDLNAPGKFVESEHFRELPSEQRELLTSQYIVMRNYLLILDKRVMANGES